MTRSYTDTRTEQGRIRFLLGSGVVVLVTEGPGWAHTQRFSSLDDAALGLALNPQVPQELYLQALGELCQQISFFGHLGAA
ncbi:hypothetical protein [Deinococcus sp.]|uniref:hypothetical protein n=1 Tax=Deinococcus sp. TaxID=47478 RepID=UPI0025CC3601|nr:hypothetical protein [Deinococcus sp.]